MGRHFATDTVVLYLLVGSYCSFSVKAREITQHRSKSWETIGKDVRIKPEKDIEYNKKMGPFDIFSTESGEVIQEGLDTGQRIGQVAGKQGQYMHVGSYDADSTESGEVIREGIDTGHQIGQDAGKQGQFIHVESYDADSTESGEVIREGIDTGHQIGQDAGKQGQFIHVGSYDADSTESGEVIREGIDTGHQIGQDAGKQGQFIHVGSYDADSTESGEVIREVGSYDADSTESGEVIRDGLNLGQNIGQDTRRHGKDIQRTIQLQKEFGKQDKTLLYWSDSYKDSHYPLWYDTLDTKREKCLPWVSSSIEYLMSTTVEIKIIIFMMSILIFVAMYGMYIL